MNRIDRLAGIILLLQSHRIITAEQIAGHYEISVRTVYRDLAALEEAGVPLVGEAGTGYRLMRGYHVPPVMFTEQEAGALFLSGEIAEQIADESLRDSLRSALLKIRSVLPKERREYLNQLKDAVGVMIRSGSDQEACKRALMPLQQAVVHRHCVALQYDTAKLGTITTRVVEPLGLVFYARQWHLIAFCRLRNAMRDFWLDRMQRWDVLPEVYHGHETFSVKTFLEEMINTHQLVPVVLRFRPHVLERVRNELMCTRIAEETLADGRIQMEMLSFSLPWLTNWILNFGSDVEAISPPNLRASVRNAVIEIAALYKEEE